MVSGGWCDFFHGRPRSDETDRSSSGRSTSPATRCGVAPVLRPVDVRRYSAAQRETVVPNLRRLSDRHPDVLFVFENHDGASLQPEVCAEILERVDRPNIRMNFDPINFERAGVNCRTALETVHAYVGHVHLKGLDRGEFCEFGTGDVDLLPIIDALQSYGYRGGFTVE